MLTNQQFEMQVQKTFVKTNDTASIRCPECALVKNIAVGKFRNDSHTLKTRCSCDTTFLVSLDFRRHYRKLTRITGIHTIIGVPGVYGRRMQINNISRSGVSFSMTGNHDMKVGQKVLLNFKLDDKKRTEVTKKVIIRRIHTGSVGCEYTNQTQIGKDLNFYLHPPES